MGDGSGGRCSTAGNGDDDEEPPWGFTRVVWFRQMLHRWQTSSNSASVGDGDGDARDAAWTRTTDDRRRTNNDAAAAGRPLLPRVVEERFPDEGGGGGGGDSPMTPDAPAGVPRGCCPVYVGQERRRFVVPTAYLGMPVFRRLLEKAEEEFEFQYGGGGVTIPCDTEAFKYILVVMERHRQGLVDDEGNAMEEQQRGGCGSSSEAQDEPTMATSSAADGGVVGRIGHNSPNLNSELELSEPDAEIPELDIPIKAEEPECDSRSSSI